MEYEGSGRRLVITEGKSVIKAFEYKGSDAEEIVIPSSVTEVKEGAFSGCRNLRRITIPESLKRIGKEHFELAEKLNLSFDTAKKCLG